MTAANLALVGSHARGTASEESDVDLVLVVDALDQYLLRDEWIGEFGTTESVQLEDYGLVQSRRVRYASGLEVEWGFTERHWMSMRPVDEATASVVRAGMRLVYDPQGLLQRMQEDVTGRGSSGASS